MSQIPNVPQDIILDILYRLPAKSLARFRCVSKLWLSILTHSKFIKTHLNKNRQNKKLLAVYNSSSLHALTLTPQNHYVSRKLNFPSNLDRNWFKIVGSCGGLVLALNGNKEPEGMFLINPTTSKYKKVSEAPLIAGGQPSLYMHGFGYDECTDDFKVVRLSYFNDEIPDLDTLVDVYSLKANCWRSIGVSPFDHFVCVDALGVLLHGAIHWSAYTRSDFSPVIAAFDFSTEKFRGLEVPPYDIDGSKSSFSKLGVIDCCLCMIIEDYVSGMDVWMMKEYGVQRSWIKLIRVSYGSDFLVPVRLIGDHELVLSNMNYLI